MELKRGDKHEKERSHICKLTRTERRTAAATPTMLRPRYAMSHFLPPITTSEPITRQPEGKTELRRAIISLKKFPKTILAQAESEGRQYLLMDEIARHQRHEEAVQPRGRLDVIETEPGPVGEIRSVYICIHGEETACKFTSNESSTRRLCFTDDNF